MNHYAATSFWRCYDALPAAIRDLADKQFELLKANPRHPSLHYKVVGRFRSARVGSHFRALGVDVDDGVLDATWPRSRERTIVPPEILGSCDLFLTGQAARFPADLARQAARKLEYVDLAATLSDLKVPPGNRLHALKDDRRGQRAIAVNDQWRICFRFVDGDAYDVEVCDCH